jgi:3-oxoacyl-[acyl-carrier protein] reductase
MSEVLIQTLSPQRVVSAVLRQLNQEQIVDAVAFSSSVIARSFPAYGPYIASKAGVEGLVHVLANELRGRNITVNAVAPGPTATELFLEGKTEAQIKEFSKIPPLERLGQPEDVANVVSFLAGPDGGWVNAQVLRANGGFA